MLRVLLLIMALTGVALAADVVEPIPGDLDRDGDVDFTDFLLFAQNFGQVGLPPSDPEPIVVVVRDTIRTQVQVTVRDTIETTTTVTVHDTVVLGRTLREQQGHALLGFWSFYWSGSGTTIEDHFCFGDISDPEEETLSLVVTGPSNLAILGGGGYSTEIDRYIVVYRVSANSNQLAYVFTIDDRGRASGKIYADRPAGLLELSDLLSKSGKNKAGTGFREYLSGASKVALRKNVEAVAQAPAEVSVAFEDLKKTLEARGVF